MKYSNENEYKLFLDDLIYDISRSNRYKKKIKLLLKTYIYIGLITSLFGGLFFILSFFKYEINSEQRISLIFVGVGILLALIAKLYIEVLKDKEVEQIQNKIILDKISTFILNWATLERTVTKLFDDSNINNNRLAIGQNIKYLFKKGIISDRDYLTLERILDIRNQIVHGKLFVAGEELDKYSNQLNEIIDKILIKSKMQ